MESQFFNNRETRALLLEAMFRNFVQGDQSIAEYTKDLKRKADMLADLGEVINDRTLVLHLIHRLNERFKQVGMLLCHGRPSPPSPRPRPTFSSRKSRWGTTCRLHRQPSSPPPLRLLARPRAPPRLCNLPPRALDSSRPQGRAFLFVQELPQQAWRQGDGSELQQGGSPTSTGSQNNGSPKAASSSEGAPFYNPWTGTKQMWPRPQLVPSPARPQQQQQ